MLKVSDKRKQLHYDIETKHMEDQHEFIPISLTFAVRLGPTKDNKISIRIYSSA